MTSLLRTVHRIFKTQEVLTKLIDEKLTTLNATEVYDLCSGSGGPLPEVLEKINASSERSKVSLVLSDLYPNEQAIQLFSGDENIRYEKDPVDVTNLPKISAGLITMICSFHHLNPSDAVALINEVQKQKLPIFIYELSDNSAPKWLWWTAIPINIIMCWLITPIVRPVSWKQILFTYLIPIIPICYAWDGAVSNIRTYDEDDFKELLESAELKSHHWEFGKVDNKMKSLYIFGKPIE